jgi:hypothetical protein
MQRQAPFFPGRLEERTMEAFKIVLLSIAAAVLYGVLHDQITARVCVEYFTIGHPPIFATEDPTLLALGWGVIATWWVGLFLGLPLALAARAGSRPRLSAGQLLRPLLILLGCVGLTALCAGVAGYWIGQSGSVRLPPPLFDKIPASKHAAFLADLGAHLASYLFGFLGELRSGHGHGFDAVNSRGANSLPRALDGLSGRYNHLDGTRL